MIKNHDPAIKYIAHGGRHFYTTFCSCETPVPANIDSDIWLTWHIAETRKDGSIR